MSARNLQVKFCPTLRAHYALICLQAIRAPTFTPCSMFMPSRKSTDKNKLLSYLALIPTDKGKVRSELSTSLVALSAVL